MKHELKVKWWEWLLLAVALEVFVPRRGRKVRWEWLALAGVLSPFLQR